MLTQPPIGTTGKFFTRPSKALNVHSTALSINHIHVLLLATIFTKKYIKNNQKKYTIISAIQSLATIV
jgi:hypothetical protein